MGDEGLYTSTDGFESYRRGPILDKKTGRYVRPVAADTSDWCCPMCQQPWPDAPFVAIGDGADSWIWVDNKFIPIKSRVQHALLTALIESFGRFQSRELLHDRAFSDWPSADTPQLRTIQNQLTLVDKDVFPGTDLKIQSIRGLGARITTKDNANDFERREKERQQQHVKDAARERAQDRKRRREKFLE